MKGENEINFNFIDDLYLGWVNEQDPFLQRKRKEELKSKVSSHDLLMYSIRYVMPFQAFKDIYPLKELFKTLEEMEERGEDITNIIDKVLIIQGVEDIKALNDFAQKRTETQIGSFRLKFQGNDLFKYGNVKKIGKKFPYACVNYIDIESINQMTNKGEDYKGVPIIITIDNMGELPLDKLRNIEKSFDVVGVRIIEKDRKVVRFGDFEYRPISLTDYKKIRTVVDDEIISKLYVLENSSKTVIDGQLATQIFYLIANKVKYDKEIVEKRKKMSIEEIISYQFARSNINGLVTGKAVCAGYSEILRNVLSCVDIKSKTILGRTIGDNGHAWNQIELGNTWFNTDLTWGRESVCEGKTSGDLFMSDAAFFGDTRDIIFNQGQYKNGISMEIKATVGGHKEVFNSNSEKCDCSLPPYMTTTLIRRAREYAEEYKRYGKSTDYKGVVPYVGSSVEKMRSSSKLVGTLTHNEYGTSTHDEH